MLPIRPTAQFKKDLKRAKRQNRDLEHVKLVLAKLSKMTSLNPRYKDHKLKGMWRDFRECHIEPDWLLIYEADDDTVVLRRTGSHSELFKI